MNPSEAEPVERLTVSIEEAVKMIVLSRSNLYRLMAAGEIASFKIGRRCLVPVASLHELVARRSSAIEQRSAH